MTTHVERSIEVAVPVRTAYDQWTRFEEFPRFMSGVEEVRQVGDALTHVGQVVMLRRLAGKPVRAENYFTAEIVAGRVNEGPSAEVD